MAIRVAKKRVVKKAKLVWFEPSSGTELGKKNDYAVFENDDVIIKIPMDVLAESTVKKIRSVWEECCASEAQSGVLFSKCQRFGYSSFDQKHPSTLLRRAKMFRKFATK